MYPPPRMDSGQIESELGSSNRDVNRPIGKFGVPDHRPYVQHRGGV
jgi:hypothetical protein